MASKRKETTEGAVELKRIKKVCTYGEKCYRRNPFHFKEFSHPHLEVIVDGYLKTGEYQIPVNLLLERQMIEEQVQIIANIQEGNKSNIKEEETNSQVESNTDGKEETKNNIQSSTSKPGENKIETHIKKCKSPIPKKRMDASSSKQEVDYRPIVPPTRRIEDFLNVVAPKGKMAEKHARSAPFHLFYTTITAAKDTHSQSKSITFQELLDPSLGELKCSLQINFMVDVGWLLAQYYFAGYSEKRLTILYGDESPDLQNITQKKPHVDAHFVKMGTPFGKHHTKMSIFCYEDGSLRVVVSTANLYIDDWENRTQGLWFSPKCPELPEDAMPHDGESPTGFKKSLLRYLNHYQMPQLSFYVERVKRCDFSSICVFLVASAPGGHFDHDWAMARIGSLLRQHCTIPPSENSKWDFIAQASSIGSYGNNPKLWLTGDFLFNFSKIQNQSQLLSGLPKLKLIYPSLENVRQSHDNLIGGGCLPYSSNIHMKQLWLNEFLYQWKAVSTGRNRAMPHIKSYIRTSPDNKKAAYFHLTSANISKAAWGVFNKGNSALRIMSYEAGVLFLPKYVINKDFFSLDKSEPYHLPIPYDLPPTKYTNDMSPWVMDYLN